jgi:parallel beta-helix repeat protein
MPIRFSAARSARWLFGAALFGAGLTTAQAAIYVVGATAALPPGAIRVAQLTAVPWATLPAGSRVIVSPGTFNGPVAITAKGTAAAPIIVRASDPANPPVLKNSIDFQAAAWVKLSRVVVQSPSYPGIILRRGSHHITVRDSVVRNAPMGINITDAAGTGHVLLRNRIEDTLTNGINVDGINASATDRTLILDNTVLRSGHHGMEVRGSNYQIEHNVVSASGSTSGGTSGIHLYSRTEADNTCDGNLIRYNYSYSNLDAVASDGNGIQADQWCDNNTIAFNVVWNNAGAGIILFNANNNQVYANTARGNGRNPGGTHGDMAELIVNGSGVAGRPNNNRVYDNVLVSTKVGVPALQVDSWAVARGGNVAGPNLLFNTAGSSVLRWTDSHIYNTAALIDSATRISGNLVKLPVFASIAQPLDDGLSLTTFPGSTGVALPGQIDLFGQQANASWAHFGAYFTRP